MQRVVSGTPHATNISKQLPTVSNSMSNTVYEGVNSAYAVAAQGGGQAYPAIQATDYRPKSLSSAVNLCLSEESLDLLPDPSFVSPVAEVCNFGEDDVTMFVIDSSIRFIPLGIPRLFILDKESGAISRPVKGEKLAGTKKVTATKLAVAMVKDDQILVDDAGVPAICTLKLTSTKTSLVTGDRNDPDCRSLQSLNQALQKHYKVRRASLTHLVSVEIRAVPQRFSSRTLNESSIGVLFELRGNARPLSEANQKLMFEFVQTDEVQKLVNDPFGLNDAARAAAPDAYESDIYEDVPF